MASPSPVFATFSTTGWRKTQETLSKTDSVNVAKFICEVITKGCRLLKEKTQETPELYSTDCAGTDYGTGFVTY
jgi:hypothetical protein